MTSANEAHTSSDQRRDPPPPTMEQLLQALPVVSTWDTAGPLILEAARFVRFERDTKKAAKILSVTEQCCIRLFSNIGMNEVAPELLLLPIMIPSSEVFGANIPIWQKLHATLHDQEIKKYFQLTDDFIITVIVVESISEAKGTAIGNLFHRLILFRESQSNNVDLEVLGDRLSNSGWFDKEDTSFKQALYGIGERFEQIDIKTSYSLVHKFFKALKISNSPVWVLDAVFTILVFPLMRRHPENITDLDCVLELETYVHLYYVKCRDTKSHFKYVFQEMTPSLVKCGSLLNSSFPPIAFRKPSSRRKIAFLFWSDGYLAHSRNYLTFLSGMRDLGTEYFEPITYILGSESKSGNTEKAFPEAVLRLGYEVRFLPYLVHRLSRVLLNIKKRANQDQISALVFVSIPSHMLVCVNAGLAPRHVWWAMKYHQIESDKIDGYLTFGSFGRTRVIDGKKWRSALPALTDLFDPGAADQAKINRNRHLGDQFTCILACIGRDEKINSRPYLEAVAKLLKKHPETLFVWTGRKVPVEVNTIINELEISERCCFVGWIDSMVYSQVIDIFIDSFPFASGYSAFEAMAANKPIVVLETPESRETSTATSLLPALRRETGSSTDQDILIEMFSESEGDLKYSPFVTSEDEYIQKVSHLIEDLDFRARSGEAGHRFIDEFLSDSKRMANEVCNHLVEIVEQKIPQ